MDDFDRLHNALLMTESNNQNVVNPQSGARGPGQIMPETAAQPGFGMEPLVDIDDPDANREFSREYLNNLVDYYNGDQELALMAYNWGLGNVDNWVASGRQGPVPQETTNYLSKIYGQLGDSTESSEFTSGPIEETVADVETAPTGIQEDFWNQASKKFAEEHTLAYGQIDPTSAMIEQKLHDFNREKLPEFVKDKLYEFYKPENMARFHPKLIEYARVYMNDYESTDEEIQDDTIRLMRSFEQNPAGTTFAMLYDLKNNASQNEKNAFGHMLQYWAKAPDMIDHFAQGEILDATDSFFSNLVRGALDPTNLASLGVGSIAAKTFGRTLIQKALHGLAFSFITDSAGAAGTNAARQFAEIEANAKDEFNQADMFIEGALGGTLSFIPGAIGTGIAVRRAQTSDILPGQGSAYTQVNPEDDVAATPTTPGEIIDEVREGLGLQKSINLDKITRYESQEQLLENLRSLTELPGMTDAERGRIASRVAGTNLETLLQRQQEQLADIGATPEVAEKLRQINEQLAFDVTRLNDRVNELRSAGRGANDLELGRVIAARDEAVLRSLNFTARTQKTANNASRLLAIHKNLMPSRFNADAAIQAMNREGGAQMDELVDMMLSGRSTRPLEKASGLLDNVVDTYMEAWYNGILGAPDTVMVNFGGAIANSWVRSIEGITAGAIRSGLKATGLRRGKPDTLRGAVAGVGARFTKSGQAAKLAGRVANINAPRVFFNEFTKNMRDAELQGMSLGMTDVMKNAFKAARAAYDSELPVAQLSREFEMATAATDAARGTPMFDQLDAKAKDIKEQLDTLTGIGASEFTEEATGQRKIPWWAGGWVVRAPGRLMGATDAYNRTLGFHQSMTYQAHVKAAQNHTPGTPEYRQAVADTLARPTEADYKNAHEFARELTFQQDNALSDFIRAAQNSSNPAVRLITRSFMPFARTPVNLMLFGMERAFPWFTKNISFEEMLARQTTGIALVGLGSWMASEGVLTGSGPDDWKIKKTLQETFGFKPYSFVTDGEDGEVQYFGIERLDPVAWLVQLGIMVHDVLKISETLPPEDRGFTDSMISAALNEAKKMSQALVMDRTYLGGLGDLMDIARGERNVTDFAAQTIAGVVPNYVARLSQYSDDWAREAAQNPSDASYIMDQLQERMLSRIPPIDALEYGGRTDLPIRVNIFARPLRDQEGSAFGFRTNLSPVTRAPVPTTRDFPQDKLINKLVTEAQIATVEAPDELWGVGLNTREKNIYNLVKGNIFRVAMENMQHELDEAWETGDESLRTAVRKEIQGMYSVANKVAKQYMFVTPSIHQGRKREFIEGWENTYKERFISDPDLMTREDLWGLRVD